MSRRRGGYLLAPVAMLLVTVAAVAFLMSFEGALGTRMLGGEAEADAAGYVAHAGLEHALWQLGESGCGGDFVLASTPLGPDSYAANVTAGGSVTSYSLGVDQDAWIRNDQPGNNSNGTDQHIRFEGGNVEHALFRFDVSSLPAGARINTASAWFYVKSTGDHPEGPVTVHRVTSDWTETGVTWDTFGGGFDAQVLDTIVAQPQGDVWVRVNLTAQVQAWVNGGEPNYGVLLASSAEGVHAHYLSREGAQPPWLEVVVGSAPASLASLQATGTLASGTSRTLTRSAASLQPPSTLILQPGASEGKDTYIWEQNQTTIYGTADEGWAADGSNNEALTLLEFDLGQIPPGSGIESATLSLHLRNGQGGTVPVPAYRITSSWSEQWTSWLGRGFFVWWVGGPGGDYDPAAVATTVVGPTPSTRHEWDLTELVRGWVDGSYPNYGVAIGPANSFGERFDTSDHADPTRHPRLTLQYACACGTPCVTPQGSGNVLMVVGNPFSLTDGDEVIRDLLEAWGYGVNLIQDDDSQGNFDAGFASNDVVYVSESVTANNVGTKLTGATIGVVNTEGNLNDELGISSGRGTPVGAVIDVIDAAHYITAVFPMGTLPFKTASMQLQTVSGTVAPGAQELAQIAGVGSLVTLETGAVLDGGGSAAGRRVLVPVGEASFDPHLTASGQLILQRAIEWGRAIGPVAPMPPTLWLSTLNDVSGSGAPGLDAWSEGEILAFGDPGLELEAPFSTAGTFSSAFDLDAFAGDGNADIDALHYVGSDITVGSANSVDLLVGDVLLSTANNETLNGTSSISVNDEDVFVFRPTTAGDYGAGGFIFLLDGSQIPSDNNIRGVSLVEQDTVVGDGSLSKGSFLIAVANRRDVIEFSADDVGPGTTSGSANEFIDGPSLGLSSEIRGLDLAEDGLTIGGHPVPQGAILLTLNNDVPTDADGVGGNGLKPQSEDVFYLNVTQVGSSPVATATLLFDGSDVSLDTTDEHLQALTLTTTVSGGAAAADGGGGPTGPIAHWKLDETSGTTAVDSVGGNDGTLINGASWAAGKLDGGLSFDGNDDYIDVSSMNPMSYDDFTVSAWYKSADSGVSDDEYIFEHNEGFSDEVTFGPTDDGTDGRLRFGFARGGSGTWDPHYGTSDVVDQQWHHVVGVRSSGRIKLYVDGVEEADGVDAHAGQTVTIDGDGPFIGDLPGNTEQVHGTLDDVRLYDRALTASEISDLFAAGGGGGGGGGAVGYVEAHQLWTANSNDTWETVDLAGFGVPADAVVEVAITNLRTSGELWGGVRAVGSSLDRRFQLHEAEGNGGDAVVLHVQADASSRIQHYSDRRLELTFTLLGYWTGASYVERFDAFQAGANASWRAHDFGAYGVGPNQVAEIVISNTSTSVEWLVGARRSGSSLARRISLHEAEGGGVDAVTLQVETDASSVADVYAEADSVVDFHLVGYWSTPPGTYVETGAERGQVFTAATWVPAALGKFGPPPGSVAQVVLTNESGSAERDLGLRETGSALGRMLDLHEAESGGADAATLHVNVDATSNGEWYGEATADSYFYPIGWWVLP